jgi:N-acyl-D-amino-acid deacylase
MVQERALFPMQRFVHRSSGLVADTFSLCDRGYLEHGRKADVVILDLDDYKPVADFRNPTALSTGVVHMLVNGIAVIRKGEYSGKLPGRILTRQECR